MTVRILLVLILMVYFLILPAEADEYAVVHTAAPVLNTPDFKAVFGGVHGKKLKTDRCGQVRELEYIALPGTVFTIVNKQTYGTVNSYQVVTDQYITPANVRLYIEGRFITLSNTFPPPLMPVLPSREAVVAALRASVGSPYVWGGNVVDGIPELAAWFYQGISANERKRLTLSGLDCSGLLYSATNGWTPRNTSQLIRYGQGVAIAGKQAEEIATILQPLDLIVWNGHVIIVLDRQTVIESRLECGMSNNGGVIAMPLLQRLAGIMRTRSPVNAWPTDRKYSNIFVVRRWYAL
jgi:hypothetical protein